MKVLHCPADVGGNAWTLSQAERKLGLDSRVMVYQKAWFGFPADIDLHIERSSKIGRATKMATFLLKAAREYDVFHFNYGSSLLSHFPNLSFLEMVDLPLLRKIGKKIVVTYQGCDVRQKSFSTSHFAISACAEPDCYGGRCDSSTDSVKEKLADKFGRYAHRVFALNPDLIRVLPEGSEFLPYASVDLDEWQPVKKAQSRKLTILHSPTSRTVKGSKYIIEAVERLKIQREDIEFILVENVPYKEVQMLYRQADIAIDQLLVGWYGRFAVEMMALGKPVICYLREEDLSFIPPQMKDDIPIVNASPESIYQVLCQLVQQRDKLTLLGDQSRAYVEKWHDPMKIAGKMKETYNGI